MKKNEKGFTLVELLPTLAVTALIALGAGMTFTQIASSTERNEDWNIAVRQAQNTAYWISQDAMMVYNAVTGDDPSTDDVEFVKFTWSDWETGDTYDTRYVWIDTAGSLKEIIRRQVVYNNDGAEIDNKTTMVATNVHNASLSWLDSMWKLSIEIHSGDRAVDREYNISRRLQE
jgi:prepilin-type N-terminal cleavage/methylation domain-containing protein